MKNNYLLAFFGLTLLFSQCHTLEWNNHGNSTQLESAPASIKSVFSKYPDKVIRISAATPGYDYEYDVAEKDEFYASKNQEFSFKTIEIRLHDKMPSNKVIADFRFLDKVGSFVDIKNVDLLRLTPKLDAQDDLVYAELLLEEFNRFGLNFRKEHGEFEIVTSAQASESALSAKDRTYRASITNNCLAGSKWEFALTTENYSDFKVRQNSDNNINQNRLLSHSWFYVDKDLYNALMCYKNPHISKEILEIDYNQLSDMAEATIVDYDKLREPLRKTLRTKILEIGHQSNRLVEPLDVEEHFKRDFGLFLNNEKGLTYKTILDEPISLTQFKDRGFYFANTPKEADLKWLNQMDEVTVDVVDIPGSDSYVQIRLHGIWSPYELTIGNVDLSLIDEQKLFGLLYGINTYPKGRRHNPTQSTISYDAELLPDEIKPYVLLTNSQSGTWVNNQYKAIEKIYLTYDTVEKDVLNIYVLSYERITPVWMARVRLPNHMRETVRIRKNLYNY